MRVLISSFKDSKVSEYYLRRELVPLPYVLVLVTDLVIISSPLGH